MLDLRHAQQESIEGIAMTVRHVRGAEDMVVADGEDHGAGRLHFITEPVGRNRKLTEPVFQHHFQTLATDTTHGDQAVDHGML